ncbi:hypothetical protein OSB04_007312 [Centaurea solstitialis]|uniref:Uncharacterized protein n=1 Tax=Centaurea solstitialis TaxID=347529 RepID=A0AA38U2W4_9ASTR|nr:hypothetical protein OSB04_007312 [Centaurea solstitialis]
MQTCAEGDSPMSKGDKLSKISKNGGNDLADEIDYKSYAQLIGSLMYAQVCTRPDLAYAVGILSRFQQNPTKDHWTAGKKVLRYLQKTKAHMLVYRQVKTLELVGYTDSDFAGNYPNSKKSTCGYIFMLAGGAIAWKTMKQSLIATSTMEAEFIAIYEGVCEGIWIKNFLIQTNVLSSIVSNPLRMVCDNEAAVFFSGNSKRSNNSKHIGLKYYSVRQMVKRKEVIVEHIGTESQLADPFTKALSVITNVILGIKITRTENGLVLSQTHYMDKILEKFNQGDTSIARTPIDTSQHLSKNRGDSVAQVEYSRIIGSLMYLMSCTRPDLTYAVSSRYTSNLSVEHWKNITRLLRYLRYTREYGLQYGRYPAVIEGYSDANWISDIKDSRSTSRYVFTLEGAAISWKSSKQTVIVRSTMESEFIALDKCGEE